MSEFEKLVSKEIVKAEGLFVGSEEVTFYCSDGSSLRMYHSQCCCESVSIYELDGDESAAVGVVLSAREDVSDTPPEGEEKEPYRSDLEQWTFYNLQTSKGFVNIRWFGESNGYYSVNVNCEWKQYEKANHQEA